ncbi:unnamed protein product [Linum tenue]|uniref:non-specific serine/threonine protein kinase n=1 Tax=Linum tenue TaxID=586396 RepID=A0AAV0LC31_9ROSI|nr:unnamed protein product [Linum tenue]
MERYELVKDLGAGNFGVARLLRHKETRELVAMKYIERGHKVVLTPTHLAIVMEYAAGGELFERICSAGRFSEDEARYFFQQLISGVDFCHFMQICHRDLKLENTLLDGSPAPRLKICDFGYSKSSLLHSRPKSTVGTPAYIAPEVLNRREYDGKIEKTIEKSVVTYRFDLYHIHKMVVIGDDLAYSQSRSSYFCIVQLADVWSCGVTLYVMLVGAYPFEDQDDPKNFRKTIQKIMAVQYKIPDYVHISQECRHLLSRIFVANPLKRISIKDIKSHPWFLKNLPKELSESAQSMYYKRGDDPRFRVQSVEDIMKIVTEARQKPTSTTPVKGFGWGREEDEEEDIDGEVEEEEDEDEEEDEYDKRVKEVHASGEFQIK